MPSGLDGRLVGPVFSDGRRARPFGPFGLDGGTPEQPGQDCRLLSRRHGRQEASDHVGGCVKRGGHGVHGLALRR
jgi:hypothetical protein